ncbi:MAG TPA: hypothetical protein VGJ05_17315 [Fimbriiglobus sp.]|jgi:hypothetical protein
MVKSMRNYLLAVASILPICSVAVGQGAAVSVNFTSTGGSGGAGTNLSAGESAGVAPVTNWNNVSGLNGTTSSLIDNSGTTTGVSVTVGGSPGTWSIPSNQLPNSSDGSMMHGYIDTDNTSITTITVSGLVAAGFTGTYHVYVYAVGNNNGGRSGDYTIGGTAYRLLDNQQFNGTFRQVTTAPNGDDLGQSGNYMDFLVSGDTFTLTAQASQFTSGNGIRAPVNGLEIAVPEPSSIFLLIGAVTGGRYTWRKTRRKASV